METTLENNQGVQTLNQTTESATSEIENGKVHIEVDVPNVKNAIEQSL